MANFENAKWAPGQMRYFLYDKSFDLFEAEAKTYAATRSAYYASFLCFEGIRYFCHRNEKGKLELILVNWDKNLERFRQSMAFNLSSQQQSIVPTREELEDLFIHKYLSHPAIRPYLEEMAEKGVQGYLRPFTLDEEHSMGVSFPNFPSIRAVTCMYDRYLGEPFAGVVIPNLVRALGANGTGCLKLGINYLISIKALDEAKSIVPEAAAVLFLDDKPYLPIEQREISEWDSSCCLFALKDGTVVKIPESKLILPSVTIKGMVAILKGQNIKVEERPFTFGELLERVKKNELVTVASVGTAGILNRAEKLVLLDNNSNIVGQHVPQKTHPLYDKLREIRDYYWDVYREKVEPLPGLKVFKYEID
ncbi:MAG: aminotransferase class IV [Candidatus Saccharicenans sp.]|jgi:branched-subunit amino acid aminotransferase/4-amino-4-deoxychorismate lyase|nr:aminotransferase class IV [Candidatus Saccharicenans sp.]HUM34131.1 aminotransferase class IV [Candidatus Saccharicenans sp.]